MNAQAGAKLPPRRHFRKRLKRGCTCLVAALLRAEWYSMYTVSSAPDMELMVPRRRDTCGPAHGQSPRAKMLLQQ